MTVKRFSEAATPARRSQLPKFSRLLPKRGVWPKVRLFPRKFTIDVTLKALLDDPADEFSRENPSFSTADLKLGNCRKFSKRTDVQNRMKTFRMSILRHRRNGNEFKTVQVNTIEMKVCLRKHFGSFNILTIKRTILELDF